MLILKYSVGILVFGWGLLASAGSEQFKLYLGQKKVGSAVLEKWGGGGSIETSGKFTFQGRSLRITTKLDDGWGLQNLKIVDGNPAKPYKVVEVHAETSKISIEVTDAKGKKTKSEIGVSGSVIPKTAFFQYLKSVQERPVNEPRDVLIFDEFTQTLHNVKWTYLGPMPRGKNKPIFWFEVKESLKLMIGLSEKNDLVRVKDLSLGFNFRNRDY